jgi:hypothetical protein
MSRAQRGPDVRNASLGHRFLRTIGAVKQEMHRFEITSGRVYYRHIPLTEIGSDYPPYSVPSFSSGERHESVPACR